MQMLDILLNLLALMAVGYAARKFKLADDNGEKAINDLVYLIGLPALIFIKIAPAHLGAEQLPFVFANLLAIGIMVLLPFLAWKLGKLQAKWAALLILCAAFGNIGFMGLPVIQMKWGADAIAPAGLLISVHNLVVFGLGVWLIGLMMKNTKLMKNSKQHNPLDTLLHNPLVLATLIGMAWSFFSIPLPGPIFYALDSLGTLAIILSLLSIGMFFATHPIGKRWPDALGLSVAKLLLLPLLAILAIHLFQPNAQLSSLTLMEAMMPIGVANYIVARRMKLDHALAAEAILLSTLLSLPLLLGFDWVAQKLLGI